MGTSMHIVRRFALTAGPMAPVMPNDKNLYYQVPAAGTTLRRLNLETGADSVVSAAVPADTGNIRTACVVGNHYCLSRPTPAPGSVSMVNLATGVVTSYAMGGFAPAVDGVQQPTLPDADGLSFYIECHRTLGGRSLVKFTPPTTPPTIGVSVAIGGLTILPLVSSRITKAGLGYQIGKMAVAPSADTAIYLMDFVNGGIQSMSIRVPRTFEGADVALGTWQTQFPVHWKKLGFLSIAPESKPFKIFGFARQDVSAEILFFYIQRDNIVATPIKTGLFAPAGAGWEQDSISYSEEFDRTHFSLFSTAVNHGFRVYSSNPAPFTLNNFIDLDTVAGVASIQGIFVFPPYIYVAKNAGGTYGPQLVQIFDEELVRAGVGKRGAELWSIVPEIGRYWP